MIVNKDGTVFAALADEPGPSRYFERLAIEAAKRWTFSPVDTEAQRLMLARFDFTREGATARAVTLRTAAPTGTEKFNDDLQAAYFAR